jgi:hypothetical protein
VKGIALKIGRIFSVAVRALGAVVVLVFLAYIGDSLSIRFKFPNRDQFGTVQIEPYYAVRLKNHKMEYTMGDAETETCVHSLFPQSGYAPCWYLSRHKLKRIDIDSVLPARNAVAQLRPYTEPRR